MGADHRSDTEYTRYQRQILLPQLGERGQRRLRSARVLVVGAGGLGSPVLQYLSAAGIGTIGVIDDDVVEESNLHRQVIHSVASIGTPKVESVVRSARRFTGDLVSIEPHNCRLTPANVSQVFAGYDVIVDAADNFPTRYLISDAASKTGKPVVWGSILGFHAQVSVFWSDPPSGKGVTLRDLFPEPPLPDAVPSLGEAGVVGALCGQAGSVMAMETIKMVARIGEPLLGRILVIDSLRASFDQIVISPDAALGIWSGS